MFDLRLIDRNKALAQAMRLTRNKATAEDLVQASMMRAWEQRERYIEQGYPGAWFYRILRNTWINTIRHERTRSTVDIDSVAEPGENPDSATIVEARELVARLACLPEPYRRVLELRALGFDYRAMASRLGVPVGTVMSRLFRARAALKGE